MIDIHCHLLPGIDDGPKTWDDSVALCRAMAADGIAEAISTPHLIDGVYDNVLEVVGPMVDELRARLKAEGIALDVRSGAEVDIASQYVFQNNQSLPTLGGGKAVLLEMPVAVIPGALSEIIFAVTSRDLVPVLAHPERNHHVQRNPGIVEPWIHDGAALQLDAESLLGIWGPGCRNCSEQLLAAGKFQAMASDAHSCDRRPPRLSEALKRAIEIVGQDAAKLVDEGPRMLLEGIRASEPLYTPVEPPKPRGRRKKKGLLERLGLRR